ncbi:hypothetical protein O9993_10385 [Vibrio lentus]|nr:hypothetical protein [Vibrio lentus]
MDGIAEIIALRSQALAAWKHAIRSLKIGVPVLFDWGYQRQREQLSKNPLQIGT